jgi:hypothetical protein
MITRNIEVKRTGEGEQGCKRVCVIEKVEVLWRGLSPRVAKPYRH